MDLLKKLFEQYFHSLPDLVVPLQANWAGRDARSSAGNEKSSAIGITQVWQRNESMFESFFSKSMDSISNNAVLAKLLKARLF